MNTAPTRPHVGELLYALYDRPLHPEWFETLAVRTIPARGGELTLRVTPSGHVLGWLSKQMAITELTAVVGQWLPKSGRVVKRRLRGAPETIAVRPGISFQSTSQIEQVPPEVFRQEHDLLLLTGGKGGVLHQFAPHHRLTFTPLAALSVELGAGYLVVSAFHTFPDEYVIVKSQTLIDFEKS